MYRFRPQQSAADCLYAAQIDFQESLSKIVAKP
jgi:hypothetical protein